MYYLTNETRNAYSNPLAYSTLHSVAVAGLTNQYAHHYDVVFFETPLSDYVVTIVP